MKSLVKFLIFILRFAFAFLALFILFGTFYWFNNRLTALEAKIIWHQKKFDEPSFKSAGPQERASMAANLIEEKKFIDTECEKIPELLGQPTGDYYHQHSNYTYRLTERESANWILTFICVNGKIESVFIRKSCCSISQRVLFWGLDIAEPIFQILLKSKPK
ncbi:MAG: hypothetical protein C5B49_15345 [Bdellovibrio sp.]|nr:MAG: hypothetical protein C5B49_15345 [Bdellovibrio sp.]